MSETVPRPDHASQARIAGVWRRLAAGFYDLLLLAAVWMLVTLIVIVLRGGEAISPGALPFQVLLFVVGAAFYISSWLRGGQTLGMRAWRIRLEKDSGAAVDLRTGLLRLATGLLTIASGGVGLLWLWVDRDGLTWHDRLAGTRVIVLPASAD
ncbi:MAG: RDD family protein [Gammaproteobacteria bacterium]